MADEQRNPFEPGEAVTPEIEGPGAKPLSKFERYFWIFASVVTGAYIIFPADFWPELVMGPLGLLDDGVAGMALLFALSKLGINIPILSRFVNSRAGKNSPGEKSVN